MDKHIFLCTDDPGVGGVAQYNHSLLNGLSKLGYQVTYVQSNASANLISDIKLGIQPYQWLQINEFADFKQTLINSSTRPDLIICSNSNPFANFAIKQTAIQLNIPYIVVEGLVEPHLADRFAQYLKELSQHYTKANSVIAVSHDNLDLLHKCFGLSKNKGQVIYYGRPSEYFTSFDLSIREHLRRKLNIPIDAVVCFTAARIETRKGYQYQLEAIKRLMHSPNWSDLYFVWVGAGIFEPQLEQELQESIKQLKITNKVLFLGQRSDVTEWLNIADIFVFPSQLEGMPLCVMEAMAKGLPVVASAVSGIPEELDNTGILIPDPKIEPEATVRELVTAIESLVAQPELRLQVGEACKLRAEEVFKEERMIEETVEVIERALLPEKDYVSPGLSIVRPDQYFPNIIVGDVNTCSWKYLRREISHNWYVDKRQPTVGFLSRDEAHILYNTALKFKGKKALEIGCWLGWSACHLALAGVELDVIDPVLEIPNFYESVSHSLKASGVLDSVNLIAGYSPQKVEELAEKLQCKWSLIFIDGDHEAPGPLNDAIICEKLAEPDALILFHDLSSPDVAQGLDYLKQKGWNTMVYQTMQIMGVAWRGDVKPVIHKPDPNTNWHLPQHLQHYFISGLSQNLSEDEFKEVLTTIRPYTLLSDARLFSIYSLAKKVCLENTPGNFVECGTYKGGAAALLAFVIKRYSLRPRRVYAFDTFEGMPDPTKVDCHQGVHANLTDFGGGTLKAPILENLGKICELLKVKDIVIAIQGLFSQTLPEYKCIIGDIAFLHADGDWYESTMDIFSTLYNNVVCNGIIQVDDYGHWEGCKKAVHEFEQSIGEEFALQTIDYTGVWFQKLEEREKIAPLILVDSVFFQLYKTGIARVWKSLLEEWAESGFAKHIIVLDRAGTAPKIPGIRYRTVPAYDYNATDADRTMLQQVCDEEDADGFISSYYTTPLSTPSVFVAYDMIPEVMKWDLSLPMWREKHHAIHHASAYLAISENTARDLRKFFPHTSSKSLTIAPCGVKKNFVSASPQEIYSFKTRYGITKPYFILVGSGGYKNTILFFKAFAQLYSKQGFEIVCTGSGWALETELRNYTSGSVVHMLQLSDEELSIAYSGAVALVYPSKYEGFGLPILEAIACGCAVITCPNGSIPEVAGEAAIYVDDDDVDELANALCEVQKPSVRNSLMIAGLEQAKKFSWAKMADTVSCALIEATLLLLNLKQINLVIFPDWSQPEEVLYTELSDVMKAIATHPDSSETTLLVDNGELSEEEANLILSSVAMNLLMEEDLDISEGLEISLVGHLNAIQWQVLLPKLKARIILANENQAAIAHAKAETIPSCELDTIFLNNCKVST